MDGININGQNLTLQRLVDISRFNEKVYLDKEAKDKVKKSREIVESIERDKKVVYGITTGFGKFANVTISTEDCKTLQRNLILSHACGAGKPLPTDVVRAIMVLRANALSIGYSGIRESTLETLIEMVNKHVNPIVFEKGSLGASGDLAPLSHMVLTMIGEGEAEYEGEVVPSKEAMEKANINIVELRSKEGLALINGTQVMTAKIGRAHV